MPTNNLWTRKTAKAATTWDKRAGEAPQDTLGTMQEAGDFELGYTIEGIQNQMNDNKSFYWGSDKDYYAKYTVSRDVHPALTHFEISKSGEATPDIILSGSGAMRDVIFGVDVDFQGETTLHNSTFDSAVITDATIGSFTMVSGTIGSVRVSAFTDTEFRGGTW